MRLEELLVANGIVEPADIKRAADRRLRWGGFVEGSREDHRRGQNLAASVEGIQQTSCECARCLDRAEIRPGLAGESVGIGRRGPRCGSNRTRRP